MSFSDFRNSAGDDGEIFMKERQIRRTLISAIHNLGLCEEEVGLYFEFKNLS